MTPPKPSRRRLTEAEFDAELKRAAGTDPSQPVVLRGSKEQVRAITRTGRRRSWWQRGWKR